MRIRLRYFATLRERMGCSVADAEVPEGSTAAQVYHEVVKLPGLPVGYAVNEQIVPGSTVVMEGDEVAVLPPLGGG